MANKHTKFDASSLPPEVQSVYETKFNELIKGGRDKEIAEKNALRSISHAGFYKGPNGWKQVHPDLREKINIREPIEQPDGHFAIYDVPIFYPNKVKEGRPYDARQIQDIIFNTNTSIAAGGQRPQLLEGHPAVDPILKSIVGKEERPVGFAVNFRESNQGEGWVNCDLVDVEPDYIEKQRTRPLTGLSVGMTKDSGGKNERFTHIAALGQSMQALSALPRTELFSSQVCFSAASETFEGTQMETNEKEVMTPPNSDAAFRNDSELVGNHPTEMKSDESNVLTHDAVDLAKDSVVEKEQELPAEEVAIPAALYSADATKEIADLKEQLAQFKKAQRQAEFQSEINKISTEGFKLPKQENINAMGEICFSSANPDDALKQLYGMFRSLPQEVSFAAMETVIPNGAGENSLPSTPKKETVKVSTNDGDTERHNAIRAMFASAPEEGAKWIAYDKKMSVKAGL